MTKSLYFFGRWLKYLGLSNWQPLLPTSCLKALINASTLLPCVNSRWTLCVEAHMKAYISLGIITYLIEFSKIHWASNVYVKIGWHLKPCRPTDPVVVESNTETFKFPTNNTWYNNCLNYLSPSEDPISTIQYIPGWCLALHTSFCSA